MEHKTYETERLVLNPMELSDAVFMLELLNTPGWIKFIGNKNAKSIEDAEKYISQFSNNPDALFWVVRLKEEQIPIGTISFMQRTYLTNPDIGFAFLPQCGKKGYAFEAANKIATIFKDNNQTKILLGITLEENINSRKLLKKLGLNYEKNIFSDENEELMLFSSEQSVEVK